MRIKDLFESSIPDTNKIVNILRTKVNLPNILTDDKAIPDFVKMSNAQRYGGVEQEMRRLQQELMKLNLDTMMSDTGMIIHFIEHIGDLTHRLGEMLKYASPTSTDEEKVDLLKSCIDLAAEKIERESRRSFLRNWRNNQKLLLEAVPDIRERMKHYRDLHRSIPVYNKLQFHSREAAVALGAVDLGAAHHHLNVVNDMIKNNTAFLEGALYLRGRYK